MHPYFEFTIPHIASFSVPAYALFAFIGLFCMMLLLYFRFQGTEMEFKRFLILFLFMAIGTGVGSKLLFIMTKLPDIISDFTLKNTIHIIWTSGFVFYGGLFGAILGVFVFAKVYKMPFCTLANIIAPGFPLFHMWGRIGCFFAGCCYGREASWGIALQSEPDVTRIPIQLFESVCLLFIFLLLLHLGRSKRGKEVLLPVYLLLYSVCRFVLEIFRGDAIRGIWLGLSTSQWISMFLFVGALYTVLLRRHASTGHTKAVE